MLKIVLKALTVPDGNSPTGNSKTRMVLAGDPAGVVTWLAFKLPPLLAANSRSTGISYPSTFWRVMRTLAPADSVAGSVVDTVKRSVTLGKTRLVVTVRSVWLTGVIAMS